MTERPLLTRSEICTAVLALGVRPGGIHLFDARALVHFAVDWLERTFPESGPGSR